MSDPSTLLTCDFEEAFDKNRAEVPINGTNRILVVDRLSAEGTQNPRVPLFCALGFLIRQCKTLQQLDDFLGGHEYHCEGCMKDLKISIKERE